MPSIVKLNCSVLGEETCAYFATDLQMVQNWCKAVASAAMLYNVSFYLSNFCCFPVSVNNTSAVPTF